MIPHDRRRTLEHLAGRLAAAWRAKGVLDHLDVAEMPTDRPEAYCLQDHMAALIDEPVSGWKIGATSAAMRAQDGHDDIIPGRLFPSVMLCGDAVTLPLGACPNPKVETEFGCRLGADMPLREEPWTGADVMPLISVHPALEVIGNRFVLPGGTAAPVRSLMGIADNGSGVAGVLGPAINGWQGIDFLHYPVRFAVDGGVPSAVFPPEMRVHPAQVVADLANLLARRGLWLRTGDVLLTGATTVPLPVQRGGRLTADFGAAGRIEMTFE